MNLYKIMVRRYIKNRVVDNIICFLLADNENSVYEWMKNTVPMVEGEDGYSFYYKEGERLADGRTFDYYSDQFAELTGTYKDFVISYRGFLPDAIIQDNLFQSFWDGKPLYGWECLEIDTVKDYSPLIDLELCFIATNLDNN